ncbi:MAG TPA: 4'-phosphopantetheinyl transferase superfamily protein [Terriglobales bacterium]|nr:4'-phosphopantetheinyl transferase superfamily protein [Terriglobales bacterium]
MPIAPTVNAFNSYSAAGMRNKQPGCAAEEVHLWRIDLDASASALPTFTATLAAEELHRAARFRFPDLGRRWTVARGALRCILAAYCDARPESLVLQTEPLGKPFLTSPSSRISFNLSHSENLALLAITEGRNIGVDIEFLRPRIDVVELSRGYLAPAELRHILALPPGEQTRAFFTCWTRKEAFLKAIGVGLSAPLDSFEVTLRPGEPARLISAGSIDPGRWNLIDVSAAGFAAAAAVEGSVRAFKQFNFDGPM